MRILQINSIYGKYSTGRTTKEMHEWLISHSVESYVASPGLKNSERFINIGNTFDHKLHAFLSRLTGLQGYFSCFSTISLMRKISKIKPDVVILRNLHSNYIKFPLLLKFFQRNHIPFLLVLHDCWFFTGKCVYFSEDSCYKWKNKCGNCPALRKGNTSFFFDKSTKMLLDKKKLYQKNRIGVIGVSSWVLSFVDQSILKDSLIKKRIYNWIDLETFHPHNSPNVRKRFSLSNKRIILGIASVWSEAKGYFTFLELADCIDKKQYQIALIGEVENLPKRDDIVYLGLIHEICDLSDIYSQSFVFINPSIQETFGKTTAESLASGTPVIAFNSCATPELLGNNNECGFLVNDNFASAYLDSLKELERMDYITVSSNCRKRAEQLFNIENNMKEYLKIFEMVTQK